MAVPRLPEAIFEACPVQPVRIGGMELRIASVGDLDPLLDFYADTQPSNEHAIPYYAVLWDAAVALARHVGGRADRVADLDVIELGCGLGLPSIVAARCGGRVLATDFHPDCGAFLRRNAAANEVELDFSELDWAAIPPDAPRFDVVLASDVIYHTGSRSLLVAAAARLCRPGGRILFADPGRDGLQDAINRFAEAGFRHELVPVDEQFVFELWRASR